MDLDKLQEKAGNDLRKNIEQSAESRRQADDTATARERLEIAMQGRRNAYDSLAAIGTHYTAPTMFRTSLAIPVGEVEVEVETGQNSTVTRKLRAVVSNTYDRRIDLGMIDSPTQLIAESISVSFYAEAEEGDKEIGLFPEREITDIGLVQNGDGGWKNLFGQYLGGETYDRLKLPRAVDSDGSSPDYGISITLYSADTSSQQEAEIRTRAIEAQLPTMQETLDLLKAGIRTESPMSARALAGITRDISFMQA